MKRKLQNIIKNSTSLWTFIVFLLIWQGVSVSGIIPEYMLPSPMKVISALKTDSALLLGHTGTTLTEAFWGLVCGIILGLITAILMDMCKVLNKILYPIIIVSQTIPTIAIAPLLVLWFGYELTPKIVLITITTFFPIAVGTYTGLHSVDKDEIQLMKSMGASKLQIYRHIKFPASRGEFFSGLRISAAYSVVGAVISEWLGGYNGLGIYMVRVKKSYSFDKMFAVIILISVISLILMRIVDILKKICMPWELSENKMEKNI